MCVRVYACVYVHLIICRYVMREGMAEKSLIPEIQPGQSWAGLIPLRSHSEGVGKGTGVWEALPGLDGMDATIRWVQLDMVSFYAT